MKKYGQIGDKHDVVYPEYHTWGVWGSKQLGGRINPEIVTELIQKAHECVPNLAELQLKYAEEIQYYQGNVIGDTPAWLLRFERKDGKNVGMGGEHITIIYEVNTRKVLGLTRMLSELTPEIADLTHQETLETVWTFLKEQASDLVSNKLPTPMLNNIDKKERMEFLPGLDVGHVQLQWIDDHGETINLDGRKTEIHGMKIKMHLPVTDLWVWVIVGIDNRVLTFERNVAWDFDVMQRQTQMWLHDDWLIAQDIKFNVYQLYK